MKKLFPKLSLTLVLFVFTTICYAQEQIAAIVTQDGKLSFRVTESNVYVEISQSGKLIQFGTLAKGNVSYNAQDRINQIGTSTIVYDIHNRVERIGIITISYNLQEQVSKVGTTSISYLWDKINKIGNKSVSYNIDNKVDRIGTSTIYYNFSGKIDRITNSENIILITSLEN